MSDYQVSPSGHPGVSTTDPGMVATGNMFADYNTEFIKLLGSENDETNMLLTVWKGPASQQFGQAMDSWETSFKKIIDQMNLLMEGMGVNVGWYRQQEQSATDDATQFAGAIPLF
jgi:uncharacterized protein YukE